MTIAYAVELAEPQAHVYRVTVTVPKPFDNEQIFMLPNWVPGSYMIRDMAGHIVSMKAMGADQDLPLAKIDKSTWRVSTRGLEGALTLVYEIYAQDPSVRLAYLDTYRAFFNPSSMLLCPLGFESEKVTLDIINNEAPNYRDWKVATGLARAKGTKRWRFGRYCANNYASLIDCPVEIGTFQVLTFKAHGKRHDVVMSGHVPLFDQNRLLKDVQRACERVIEFFDSENHRAPFDDYVFLLHLTAHQYGGLEHANSSALVTSFNDLPLANTSQNDKSYQTLLTLMTHEYFHAWWVKRVRPAMFVPYDLSHETYTNLLWLFEGFTSYYDEKLVHEAGLVSDEAYCRALGEQLTEVMANTARYRQTLTESSFDAWIKYYKPDGNRPNAVVSYYTKGALVALAIDAEIRRQSGGAKCLGDVLRYAYKQYLQAQENYAGIDEDAVSELIWEATGVDLTTALQSWVYATKEPDYEKALNVFGLKMRLEPLSAIRSRLGVSVRDEGGEATVVQVFDGTSAQVIGLQAGDRLVAIDNVRIRTSQLESMLKRFTVGQEVSLYVFRDDILLPLVVTIGEDRSAKVVVETKRKSKKFHHT